MTIYQNKQLYYLDDNNSELKSYREKPRKSLQDKLERTKTALKWNADLFHSKKNDPFMQQMFNYLINPSFGEPIFKFSCYLHTGYFTSGAEKIYTLKVRRARTQRNIGFLAPLWVKLLLMQLFMAQMIMMH